MKRRTAGAALGVALLLTLAGDALAGDAAQLLAGLRDYYAATRDLQGRFVQVSELAASGMERRFEGSVAFEKGGKMRWSYEGDDPQVIVSDGTTLWVHQVRDRTILKQELASLPPQRRLVLDLLDGLVDVQEAFQLDTCGPTCVELVPREPRVDLSRVRLELGAEGRGLEALLTEDPLGNSNRVEFRDLVRNAGLAPDTFRMEPPAGVQVLDMPGEGL